MGGVCTIDILDSLGGYSVHAWLSKSLKAELWLTRGERDPLLQLEQVLWSAERQSILGCVSFLQER